MAKATGTSTPPSSPPPAAAPPPAAVLPPAVAAPPPPPLPHEPDRFKLHNEINQLMNQRFLLTAGAVALFGAIAKQLFPTIATPTFDAIATAALVSSVYSILLCVLFYQSLQIRKVVRTYSTYLRVKGWSEWERDWHQNREFERTRREQTGRTHSTADLRAHGTVFAAMAALTFLSLGVPTVANAKLSGPEQAWQPWYKSPSGRTPLSLQTENGP